MPRDGRESGPLDPGDGSGQSQATPPVDNAEVLSQGPKQLSLHCGGAKRKARDIRNNLAGTNMSRRGWLQASPTVLRRQVSVSGSTAGTSSTHRDLTTRMNRTHRAICGSQGPESPSHLAPEWRQGGWVEEVEANWAGLGDAGLHLPPEPQVFLILNLFSSELTPRVYSG